MVWTSFETRSVRLEPVYLLTVQAPADDVDRIMGAVVRITPLAMGVYDSNAYQWGRGSNAIGRWRGPPQDRRQTCDGAPAPSSCPSSCSMIGP